MTDATNKPVTAPTAAPATAAGKGLPGSGRRVVLVPTPAGFWMALLGVCMAAVSPLFGFLVGTIIGGTGDDALFGPMYLGLFSGIVLGAVGVVAAVVGARRLWLDSRVTDDDEGPRS